MQPTNKEIEEILHKNYDSRTRKRGYSYYNQGNVEDLIIDVDGIEAMVQGSDWEPYEVEMFFDEDDGNWVLMCSCPVGGDCKHEVALLYTLLYEKNGSLEETIQRIIPKEFKENSSGVFRTIEFEGDFLSAIEAYSPTRPEYLNWHEKVRGRIIESNIFEIDTINTTNYYKNNNDKKVHIISEAGAIKVKCLTCNTKGKKLCQHQFVLLRATGGVLKLAGINSPDFTFGKIKESLAKAKKISVDAFDMYYQTAISHEGFYAQKSDRIVSGDHLSHVDSIINRDQNRRALNKAERALKATEGRPAKFAFLWPRSKNIKMPGVVFMRGYGMKTKEGIHSSSRIVEAYPNLFPRACREIGQKLKRAEVEDFTGSTIVESVRELLASNTKELNQVYHYLVRGEADMYRLSNSDIYKFQFNEQLLNCSFVCEQRDNFLHLTRKMSIGEKVVKHSEIEYYNLLFTVVKDSAFIHSNVHFLEIMQIFGDHDTILFEPEERVKALKILKHIDDHFDLEMHDDVLPEKFFLENGVRQIYLKDWNGDIVFESKLVYGDKSFNPLVKNEYILDEQIYQAAPDEIDSFLEFLLSAHPGFHIDNDDVDYLILDYASMLQDEWFMNFMTSCENAGIEVLGQKDLRKFRYSNKKAIASTHVNSGIRWFDVTIDLAFDKEKVKKSDWIRAIKNNESYVTLKDGTLGVLPSKWIEQVKKILAVAEIEKEAVKISKYRFNIIEDIFEDIDDQELLQELHDKKKKFLDLDFKKKHKVPKEINAELRDYQYAGYQWLKFLDESEFGGILADDMGLGKTLQVLCLLANQKKKGTSLVIVPRTLLYNWSAEIERFCPSLEYAIHHGIKRATELSDYKKTDVIISTYGTVLSDISKFKEEDYNYIILDESQAIKNPNSLRYKAMKLLNARNKLAMTGTPIENNTMDLYAQLNFVVPGLLGSISHFKKNFTVPIDNRGNAEAAELLRKLIRPFMLRRTKEQVAKDLPDKTESIIYCEMGAAQRKLYEELKEKIRQDVHSKVAESGVAKSKFFMLDGLLRLRQLCNSPLLVNSAFTGANAKSTKIDLLCERLSQNIEDRNTLIFSQFVGLLTIVKKELDKRKITYAYLDGSTRNRKAEVDKFMNNEDIKVFIISIKAGNTGMNLTKADYVYILDPWWNPAVEAQAIDRTHRIGQDKKVFAYKLICKDTIEEKIIQLQERKKNLAKDIIQVDENILKSLNKTDLLALFD